MSFDDLDPWTLYERFNQLEAASWLVVAIAIQFVAKPTSGKQRFWLFAASAAFVLFGISDWFESGLREPMPVWLWLYKIVCGALILACRIFYIGTANFRWTERYFLLMLGCLIASIATIVVHHYI